MSRGYKKYGLLFYNKKQDDQKPVSFLIILSYPPRNYIPRTLNFS